MMTGKDLKKWRKTWGLNRWRAAELTNTSFHAWKKWEIGQRRVPPWMPNLLRDAERQITH